MPEFTPSDPWARADEYDVFDALRPAIFRVAARWFGGACSGTAFAVAESVPRRLILATARHVLEVPQDQEVEWTLEQFGRNDVLERRAIVRQVGGDGPVPYRWNKHFDVGFLVAPALEVSGKPLMRNQETIPIACPSDVLAGAGQRVSWAGYMALVERRDFIAQPILCYFEGVICATVNLPDKHLYIIDGHSGYGVSGGPLWKWSDQSKRPEILGIMTQYFCDGHLPGVCVFEPIRYVMDYLRVWKAQLHRDRVATEGSASA